MPQDAAVVEDKPGKCPICKMDLMPVRLDTAWSCPEHPAVIRDGPGKCPIDRRDLVQVTVSVYWTCAARPDLHELSPGTCPDSKERILVREKRAHGDHNPRHGGQFFMASDNWHHVEGTYPRDGLFRVFAYDEYTKPIAVRGFAGRAVTREEFDPATRTWKEVESVSLKPSADGKVLEARIKPAAVPVRVAAKVKFKEADPEQRFDFTFGEYTKEPPAGGAPLTSAAAPVQAPAAPTTPVVPSVTPGAAGQTASVEPTPSGAADGLPDTRPGLLAALTTRTQAVEKLISDGMFTQVYVAAMATKEVALALETHVGELPDPQRIKATAAVKQVLLSAWTLDFYGDLGNKERLNDAYNTLAAAVADLTSAYAGSR